MAITRPEKTIVNEVEEQRPSHPAGLLSRQERDLLIERGARSLYRWYTTRSQKTRRWHPDQSFDWRALRTDHSTDMNNVIEGFYGIENYAPDYTSKLTHMMRKSYGRANFQMRWGAEEEKHSDLWLNCMLFMRFRTPEWIEDYMQYLRNGEWKPPWEDPLHVVLYVVIQERATQLTYLNMARIASGKSDKPGFTDAADPELVKISRTIATDEAAHYNFFLEIARLYLYYYPAETIEALVEVLENFGMPAMELVPDGAAFAELVYRGGIYGPREYSGDVLKVALKNMGVHNRRALEKGVKRSRQVPDTNGKLRDTAIFDGFDYQDVESSVKRLFGRLKEYEEEVGLAEIIPTEFVPSGYSSR
jgi:acyl-[acyl-carrier-protein] desaturase